MSGPKVVRVITREERIETCDRLLAQLDVAVRRLKADSTRWNDAEGTELATSSTRRDALLELIRQDAFDQAERQAQQEIDFITAKRGEVMERAASTAAVARRKLSQQRHAATTLLKELERRAPAAHAELSARLGEVAHQPQASDAAEAVLAMALMALAPASPHTQLSEAQKALAKSLQGVDDQATGWRAPVKQDKRISELQHRLSQIEVLQTADATTAFTVRLEQLELEAEGPVRNMKLDALVIDVSAAVDTLKRVAGLTDAAQSMLQEISSLGTSADLLYTSDVLEAAIASHAEETLKRGLAEASEALGRARAARAATARREAILAGLESLGYQINEGMATSWVEAGRVVLKKSDADVHGIEIASAPDAQRLQVRAVAFLANLPPASDLAAEHTWCGDFTKLQEHLKRNAGELAIEKALPVGATPLKIVDAPTATQSHNTNSRQPRAQRAR